MAHATLYSPWAGTGYKGRLVAEIDDLPALTANTSAINVTVRWHVEFTVETTDTNNTFYTAGSWAPTSGTVNVGVRVKAKRDMRVSTVSIEPKFGEDFNLHVYGTLTGIENIGLGTVLKVDSWISVPPKPHANPKPPLNFTVQRSGEAGASLSWEANYTSGTGATPWRGVEIERRAGVDKPWERLARLSWNVLTLADTNLPGAGSFRYRIRSYNLSGTSRWVEGVTTIHTTPPNPTWVQTDRNASGGIVLTWESDGSRWEVWHSLNGVWESAALATRTSRSYTHAVAQDSNVHRYRIYTVTESGVRSDYVETLSIAGSAAPARPTGLAPTGKMLPRELDTPLVWRHVPVDGTRQSAYEVQFRTSTNGGTSWTAWTSTGKTASTGTHVLAANLFAAGVMVEWQVRTWGGHATASPWSSSATFTAAQRPVVTITRPGTSGDLDTDRVTLSWTAAFGTGASQVGYTASLEDADGDTLEVRSGTTGTTLTFNTKVLNVATYTVTVIVTDSNGLTSATASRTFTAAFTPPPEPAVTLTRQDDIGEIAVTITNTGLQTPPAVFNRLYRNGDLIADNLPLNSSFVDRLAPLADIVYRVEAVAASGSTATTDVTATAPRTGWFFVNYGEGFRKLARARFNPKLNSQFQRTGKKHQFVGQTRPVVYSGPVREQTFSVAALIEYADTTSSREAWVDVVDEGGVACYRDPLGRRVFGSVDDVRFTDEDGEFANLAFTFEEGHYVE